MIITCFIFNIIRLFRIDRVVKVKGKYRYKLVRVYFIYKFVR